MDLSSLTTVAQLILDAGAEAPERVVSYSRQKNRLAEVNFRKLEHMVFRMATYLFRRGVRRGDSVALYADDCFEFWVADFACQIVGAVSVIIHPLLSETALVQILKKSGTKICVAGEGLALKAYEHRNETPLLREIIALHEAPRTHFVSNFNEVLESVDSPAIDKINKNARLIRPDDLSVVFWSVQKELIPAAYTHGAVLAALQRLINNKIEPAPDTTVLSLFSNVDYCARLIGVYLPLFKSNAFAGLDQADSIISCLPMFPAVTVCAPLPFFSRYMLFYQNVKEKYFAGKPFHLFVHTESNRQGFLNKMFQDIDSTLSRSHIESKIHIRNIAAAISWGEADSYSLSALSVEFGFRSHRLFCLPCSVPLGEFTPALNIFIRGGDTGPELPVKYVSDIAKGGRYKPYLLERIKEAETAASLYEEPCIPAGQYFLPVRYFEEQLMFSRLIRRALVVSNGQFAGVLVVPNDSLASMKLKPSGMSLRIEEDLEKISSGFLWQLPLKRFALIGSEYAVMPREELYRQCSEIIQKMLQIR